MEAATFRNLLRKRKLVARVAFRNQSAASAKICCPKKNAANIFWTNASTHSPAVSRRIEQAKSINSRENKKLQRQAFKFWRRRGSGRRSSAALQRSLLVIVLIRRAAKTLHMAARAIRSFFLFFRFFDTHGLTCRLSARATKRSRDKCGAAVVALRRAARK